MILIEPVKRSIACFLKKDRMNSIYSSLTRLTVSTKEFHYIIIYRKSISCAFKWCYDTSNIIKLKGHYNIFSGKYGERSIYSPFTETHKKIRLYTDCDR